ncbi:hypothetical protein [Kitasatospora sp. NPDC090091]|uniref:hypothetical protein n=1 Tax=Kitasatospora sp. NPDC090091 TaxID=3364081 RepID=UPI003801184A
MDIVELAPGSVSPYDITSSASVANRPGLGPALNTMIVGMAGNGEREELMSR